MDWPGLPDALVEWRNARERQEHGVVYLPGGGGGADWIRRLDAIHGLGDCASHALAIRAMGLNAHALAALPIGATLVTGPPDTPPAGSATLVLDPVSWLLGSNAPPQLPESWDATSDAIAACLAQTLGAAVLVLLKSVDLPPGRTTTEQARDAGLVDPAFPSLARGLARVEWVNLRHGPAGRHLTHATGPE
jgi:aspartokinase-like uncharacterized kinase